MIHEWLTIFVAIAVTVGFSSSQAGFAQAAGIEDSWRGTLRLSEIQVEGVPVSEDALFELYVQAGPCLEQLRAMECGNVLIPFIYGRPLLDMIGNGVEVGATVLARSEGDETAYFLDLSGMPAEVAEQLSGRLTDLRMIADGTYRASGTFDDGGPSVQVVELTVTVESELRVLDVNLRAEIVGPDREELCVPRRIGLAVSGRMHPGHLSYEKMADGMAAGFAAARERTRDAVERDLRRMSELLGPMEE